MVTSGGDNLTNIDYPFALNHGATTYLDDDGNPLTFAARLASGRYVWPPVDEV